MAAPITERVFTMPAILFFYLKTFFFPKDLTVDQKWLITHQGIQFYLPLFIDTVFLIGIILFGVWIYRTRKVHFSLFLFFTLWFLVGIGFHMQLLPLDMTVADRWFYFPMVGLLGIIGVGLNTTLLRTDKVKSTVIIACFLLIGILTMRTIARNTIWYNEITFRSNGAQEGDAIPMYDDYLNEEKQGLELMDKGMMEQAVPHFVKSIELNPTTSVKICHSELIRQSNSNCKTANEAIWEYFSIDAQGNNRAKTLSE